MVSLGERNFIFLFFSTIRRTRLIALHSSTWKMTTITPLKATDLLKFGTVNLDCLTENYHLGYYLEYLIQWPSLCFKAQNAHYKTIGYMLSKSEGDGKDWHSHITAVTVDYNHRRLGIANDLCRHLEHCSNEKDQNVWFMDLFVRASNRLAIDMYRKLGFDVFRRVIGYYHGAHDGEDAFDMRKPMKRDVDGESLVKSSQTVESPHFKYEYRKQYLQ